MDDDKGHVDEPVTREGHVVPTGIDQPGVEEVVETVIARNAEYPTDIGEQMPQLTYSSYNSKPESGCEESETFPPQAGNCGEMEGEMKTKTNGYSAN